MRIASPISGRNFEVLRQIGLHQPQLDAVDEAVGAARQPYRAGSRHRRDQNGGAQHGRRAPAQRLRVDQRGRRGENQHGREIEAMLADQRRRLREDRRAGQRHADIVPGKAGQHMAAQPFRAAEPDGQRADPQRSRRPQQPRQREAERREHGEAGRNAQHRERQRPGELVRFDQHGGAQPPETGDEIAKPEPPAGARGGAQRGDADPPRRKGRAVDKPDRDGQGNRHGRRETDRLQRQGPAGAGAKGDRPARPSFAQDDTLGKGQACRSAKRFDDFMHARKALDEFTVADSKRFAADVDRPRRGPVFKARPSRGIRAESELAQGILCRAPRRYSFPDLRAGVGVAARSRPKTAGPNN